MSEHGLFKYLFDINSSSKCYVDRTWKELRVGDVVHLRSNELVPADILLLNSSDSHGVCYIDSCNLDGETSLKQRESVRGLGMDGNFDPGQLNFSVEISPPTTKIYHFLGSIPVGEGGKRIALNESNLLLRSCFVKNTDFVEGLVVYAGSETKVMLNSSSSRYKRSRLERHMNTAVLCCVAILLVMCLLSATGSGVWQAYFDKASASGVIPFLPPVTSSPNDGRKGADTLEELVRGELSDAASPAVRRLSTSPGWVAFLSFWTYVIIFQVIIPIALYVTIEIIKMLQVYHIQNDPNFVDPRTDTSIECRAMNITEELGQVQYVFTDKTGTLTENSMIFQRCSINGVDYEHEITMHDSKSDKSSSNDCGDSFEINDQLYDDLHSPGFPLVCTHQPPQQQDTTPSLAYHQHAPLVHQGAAQQPELQKKDHKKLQPDNKSQQQQHSLQKHLQQQDPEVHQERILNFMLTLVLCNTVIVAKTPHTDKPGESVGVIPPTPGATPPAGSDDVTPSSVPTPSRLIPSLRAFTPLIRIPPLPERPHLNFRSLNPFSRPLSPIASSPSASPEVFPKHRNKEDGVASLQSSVSQQEAGAPSVQFFAPSEHKTREVQNRTAATGGFMPLHFPPEGEPSFTSELGPDSGMSSCATSYTDVPLELSSTPAEAIVSFPSISPSVSTGVKTSDDIARHSTPTKGVPSKNTSEQDAESISTTSNAFDTFGSSVSKASGSNEGAAFSPSLMNLAQDVQSDSQSTNLPLINLTLNPFSDDSRDTSNNSSRRTSTSLSNIERSNGAFINSINENSIGFNNSRASSTTNNGSNQANYSPGTLQGKLRIAPPKTLQIPSLKLFAPRSPRSSKLSSSRVSEQVSCSSTNPFRGNASSSMTGTVLPGLASVPVAPSLSLSGSAEVPCASSVSAAGLSLSKASSISKDKDDYIVEELPVCQKPLYEAESPDELALVEAAYKYGMRLLRRDAHAALIDVPGSGLVQFEVLHVFPFDSTRKRMSVMVRDPRTGHITLYCKGADSAILDNLDRACDQLDQFRQFRTHQHLYVYSKCGLRTLCVATRCVSEAEYAWWRRGHDEAEASFSDREFKLQNSYKLMEKSLILLGATGIEDRLQPLVPETLAALRKAGIIIWLLTGDKQETAVNVAHSAALFSPTMQIMKLNARTREQAEVTIRRFLESCSLRGGRHAAVDDEETGSTLTVATAATDASAAVPTGSGMADASVGMGYATTSGFAGSGTGLAEAEADGDRERGLVVDGKTLTFILDRSTNLLPLFLELAEQCRSVLISRATPLQKALVVKLTKQSLGILSMAVGDGANDVSMIQTADVGVGISGVEGRQAVMSSDFAISRFCHLRRLLLLHGHWCYHRLASIILYFFYKNANLVLVLLWYQFYCSFTGNNFVDQMYLIQFSLTFTSVPPVIVGAYDKDAPSSVLLSEPHLYSQGRLDEVFKHSYFWINILDAAYQSLIVFFFAVGVTEVESKLNEKEWVSYSIIPGNEKLLQACIDRVNYHRLEFERLSRTEAWHWYDVALVNLFKSEMAVEEKNYVVTQTSVDKEANTERTASDVVLPVTPAAIDNGIHLVRAPSSDEKGLPSSDSSWTNAISTIDWSMIEGTISRDGIDEVDTDIASSGKEREPYPSQWL
ncbi:P-type ATPase subfamily IV [Trinorchestia longiramus]|nr:P-type ATPase subfamily IV [Trinorchestia longiramus]